MQHKHGNECEKPELFKVQPGAIYKYNPFLKRDGVQFKHKCHNTINGP